MHHQQNQIPPDKIRSQQEKKNKKEKKRPGRKERRVDLMTWSKQSGVSVSLQAVTNHQNQAERLTSLPIYITEHVYNQRGSFCVSPRGKLA